MRRLPARQKRRILGKVLKDGFSISSVCRQNGISRKTFYAWEKKYLAAAPRNKLNCLKKHYLKGLEHPRGRRDLFKKEVLRIVSSHPEFGSRKISKILRKKGKFLSNHAVYTLLKDLNLEIRGKREEFSSLHRALLQVRDRFAPGPRRLLSQARKRMAEEVLLAERKVGEVAKEFKVSRKTVWKWVRRYQEARERKITLLLALADQHPIGSAHPRGTPEWLEKKILAQVVRHPEYSTHTLAKVLRGQIGNHGIQNVLFRNGLNIYKKRLAYAQVQVPVITPITGVLDRLKLILERIPAIWALPPPARDKIVPLARPFVASFLFSVVFSTIFIYWLRMFSQAPSLGAKLGLFFASISLTIGSFFFAYSMKYYLTLAIVLSFSRQAGEEGIGVGLTGQIKSDRNGSNWLQRIFGLGNGNGERREMVPAGGLQPSLDHIKLKRYPFVSIHLPFYNERNVAERILKACTSIDYPNFEVVVIDDSTDETTKITRMFADKFNAENADGPIIKVLHRPTRAGFKGGALAYALEHTNPKTEFVVVFDADFIPYPDTLELFIKYFKANNQGREDYAKSNIAVVGGYQWHVLNKSENWITRGVRCEYAGSYVIERPGREILGLLKQISGSVYMIRADLLKRIGWGTSITEDFQLTLKLYEQGYKVIYTPYIQGPAECASTLKRLIRQRMRWAEGHSNNIRKMFFRLISSPKLTLKEKVEVLYLSPYYLQAFFFLIGTFSWLLAETVFRARLPFWTSLWGWSLVLTNLFSLPLMNAVGLFLEESEEKDYVGLLSFIALSCILVPFQAYASVKGFLEKEEGPWFRTPKTGKITDIFTRGRFYRWLTRIVPIRSPALAASLARQELRYSYLNPKRFPISPYVAIGTANSRFDEPPVPREISLAPLFGQSKQFAFLGIKVARRVVFSKATLALLLVVTMFLNYMAFFTIETPKKSEVQKIQPVEGGGTEIFKGEPVNTNLKENEKAAEIKKGAVQAAESSEEIYRWQVELSRATYSFGLQEPGGIKPVVKMENERRGGNFIRFKPDDSLTRSHWLPFRSRSQYVEPNVEGNQIEWEIKSGLKAKYAALTDRIKADYVIEKPLTDALSFAVQFSDTEDNPRVFETRKDGSISLIMENYSEEVFRFLAPTAEDAEGKEGQAEMNIQKAGQGTAILTITLEQAFLASATYPITIDPTTLNSNGMANATAYGSERTIVRDSNGSLITCYKADVGLWSIVCSYSNDSGVSWTEDASNYSLGAGADGPSIGLDSNDDLHIAWQRSAVINNTRYYKVGITRSGSSITGISWPASTIYLELDSSGYSARPSLIVTNMGSNDHVAVAWDFGGKSGGTNRYGMRFMHCKLSDDCTSISNWCKAGCNGSDSSCNSTDCGTAASSLTADGTTDTIFLNSTRNAMVHGALNQLDPDGSNTYSKALVAVGARDDTNDIGAAYARWDSSNYHWGVDNPDWTENATSISSTEWDDADGYNLTLAQDNNTDKLAVSYRDTGNTKLETKQSPTSTSAPTGSWTDLTFPSGNSLDPSTGVDNTNGLYYNFYKNSSGNIAFRQADGANFGDQLGNTTAESSADTTINYIKGSKFTLSETNTFTEITIRIADSSAGANFRVAIYTDDGGSPSSPDTLVVESDSVPDNEGIVKWLTIPIESTKLTTGNTYWLVSNMSSSSVWRYYGTGASNQGIAASYTYGSFPLTFPGSGCPTDCDSREYSIYAEVGWSGEIVLDQASTTLAYPSVTEAAINTSTTKKIDLIYTGGTTTYSVYYHTWHFEDRYSYGDNITGYGDQDIFMDEDEYDSQSADDTDYTSQSVAADAFGVFVFKLKNTNRAANPDLDPTWEGCFVQPISRDIFLSIYNRELGAWPNIASGNSSTQCSSEGDFIQLSPNPPVTGDDKYYFADDWVYFRVYALNFEASSYDFYSDWFDTQNLWVPERTLLTLLILALFLPRIVREFKLRKELAYEKAETREINL